MPFAVRGILERRGGSICPQPGSHSGVGRNIRHDGGSHGSTFHARHVAGHCLQPSAERRQVWEKSLKTRVRVRMPQEE